MELLEGGAFNYVEPGLFDILTAGLRHPQDQWVTMADFRSYIDVQREVNSVYDNQDLWGRMSIINVANSGWFSSDRTIQQYADEIWKVKKL